MRCRWGVNRGQLELVAHPANLSGSGEDVDCLTLAAPRSLVAELS